MILTVIQRWIIYLVVVLAAAAGAGFFGYEKGIDHQKQAYLEGQLKADVKVVSKNQELQTNADQTDKVQIVYKDRIVVKYKTIEKKVDDYEKTKDAAAYLDSEFVRLHDSAAAANDQVQIAGPTSGTNGEDPAARITTGQAIGVITRNYEKYQQCERIVEGWQSFYGDLQQNVNNTK